MTEQKPVVITIADGRRLRLPDLDTADFVIIWKSDDLRKERITRTGIAGTDYKGDLVTNGRGPDREANDEVNRDRSGRYCGTGSLSPKWIRSITAVPKVPGKRFRSRIVLHGEGGRTGKG